MRFINSCIGAVTGDTIPPKGAGEPFPGDSGLTGDLLVARETFIGGDTGASVCVGGR
jgi:hypothetical protein